MVHAQRRAEPLVPARGHRPAARLVSAFDADDLTVDDLQHHRQPQVWKRS